MTYSHIFYGSDADTEATATDRDFLLQRDCEMDYLSSSSSEAGSARDSASVGSSGVSTPIGSFFGSSVSINSGLIKELDVDTYNRSRSREGSASDSESEDLAFVVRRRGRRAADGECEVTHDRTGRDSKRDVAVGKLDAVGAAEVAKVVRKVAEELSRSPSPLGVIPIHKRFSKLVHKHEVPRKLLHVSIGGLAIYLYTHGWQPKQLTPWLAAALVPIVSADILRLKWAAFNRFYIRVLGALMRESEVRGTNGVVWYLAGTLTVMSIFPKDVATLSVLLLSWCDTAASTFGRAYGKYTPKIRKGKSLAGCLASFFVGAVTAAAWWGWLVPRTGRFQDDPINAIMFAGKLAMGGSAGKFAVNGGLALGLMSLWTGLVASVSEVLDVWGLDDNVVIPVVSAVGMWGFLKVFG